MDPQYASILAHALALSLEMLNAAEQGRVAELQLLDAQRLELLKSFRIDAPQPNVADRALLRQISELNDRAIGLLEHHRRSKGRDLDMAGVGRRAVAAYSGTRLQRL
ncbi:MAG: hypothetical protein QOK23_2287 [Gammaproteobacteria bacterium]|jgi:hypothetical protein|nr:hypothetical protein [Gammaproteobacteria bacterium]